MFRSFEKCGRLWKVAWLHYVDNIQQKDIKKQRGKLETENQRIKIAAKKGIEKMESKIQIWEWNA